MNKVAVFFAGILLLSPAAAQDFPSDRSGFLDAVRKMDESRVRSRANAVAGADSRRAVETLLDGYGICARHLQLLGHEKAKNLGTREENSDFRIDTSTSPPTIPSGDINKYRRYEAAVKAARATDMKIMRVKKVGRAIVAALSRFKSREAIQGLVTKLKNDSPWTRRAGIAEAMGSIGDDSLGPVLVDRLKRDSEPQVKIAIMDALRARKARSPDVVAELCARLKSRYGEVRSTALSVLRDIGPGDGKSAVGPLITAMGKAKGRLRGEINRTLVALTGVDKHGSVETWRSWWEENRGVSGENQSEPRPVEKAGRKEQD